MAVFSSLLLSVRHLDAFAPLAIHNNPPSLAQKAWQTLSMTTSLGSSSNDAEDEIVPIDAAEEEVDASDNVTVDDEILTIVDETTNDPVAEEPADVPVGEPEEEEEETPTPLSKEEMMENLLFLQSVATITSRGEYASKAQKNAIQTVVAKLEASNPNPEPTITTDLMEGTWELVLADNGQLFRSSPFFMAGRAVCTTPEQAKQYDWFCSMHRKALAISNIVSVRQVVSRDRLVSEFVSQEEQDVAASPVLPQ